MADDIRWVRARVGHEPIVLTFAAAIVTDEQGRDALADWLAGRSQV